MKETIMVYYSRQQRAVPVCKMKNGCLQTVFSDYRLIGRMPVSEMKRSEIKLHCSTIE
ncbi:MAG: hypothetical protein NC393_03860 [Clostridium sp.]|nr:hypothetical protein [Clostridium sp.]MCM1207534.1 hypothetical protein [Ruminococcus sp.]